MNGPQYRKKNRNKHTVQERRQAVRICCGMVFQNPEKSRKYKLHIKIKHPGRKIEPICDADVITASPDITTETLLTHFRSL